MNTDQSGSISPPRFGSTPRKRPRLHYVEEEDEETDVSTSMMVEESGSEYNPEESLQSLPASQE